MAFEFPKSLNILREACGDCGVAFELIDEFSGFVVRLSKGGCSVLAGAAGIGIYPVNRAAPFAVARDKAFTHYLLRKDGFAVPEGEHFFLRPQGDYVRPEGRERTDAMRYAETLSANYAKPLVVKPNAGKGAKLVTFVGSPSELSAALDEVAEIDDLALVQGFIDDPEFRLFLIDGEVAFAYRKTRTEIEGDGQTTVRALCEALTARSPGAFARLSQSAYLRAELASRGLTLDSVLAENVHLPVDFVSNISASGRFAGFLEPSSALRDWARRLARTVGLRVTGIDIFSRSGLDDVHDIVVTDVNGSPNLGTLYDMGHRELVLDVWRRILSKTFDDPWPEGF